MTYKKALPILLLIAGSALGLSKEKLFADRSPGFRYRSGLTKATLAILHEDRLDYYEMGLVKGACLSSLRRTLPLRDSGQILKGMAVVGPNYANYTLNNCLIDSLRFQYMWIKPSTDSLDTLMHRLDKFRFDIQADESILLPPEAFRFLLNSRFNTTDPHQQESPVNHQ